jgi:hypothetical protein
MTLGCSEKVHLMVQGKTKPDERGDGKRKQR